MSLERYFNYNDLVIEINNTDDEYNVFIYFRKRKCYKNYSNNYDELNLVLKNKDALINKNIEMKFQE